MFKMNLTRLFLLIQFIGIHLRLSEFKVIEFDDKTFKQTVLGNNDLWLVEFYAPWCGHCKKLAPVLDELAEISVGKMSIGKVDATRNTESAKAYNVDSFPTLLFFKGGVSGEYEGSRSLESLKIFMNKMLQPSVSMASSMREVNNLLQKETVVFLLTEGSDSREKYPHLNRAFYAVADALKTGATFVAIEGTDRTFVQKLESNREGIELKLDAMETGTETVYREAIQTFVKRHNFPLIAQLDGDNFSKLAKLGLHMVIAVVDYGKPSVTREMIERLDTVVSTLPREQTDKLIFGHLDGIKWSKFAKNHNATAPAILVLDTSNDKHFSSSETHHLTVEGIQSLVHSILKLPGYKPIVMQSSISADASMLGRIKSKLREYYPWSLLCFLPLLLIIVTCFLPQPDEEHDKEN